MQKRRDRPAIDSISVVDADPPPTTLQGVEASHFVLIAHDGSADALRVAYFTEDQFSPRYVDGIGRWELVPEPPGVGLDLLAIVAAVAASRRRSS